MSKNEKYDGLEIAVIGISSQFAESSDYRKYWQNLIDGRELITTFSEPELIARGLSEKELGNESFVRSEGYMNKKENFDAGFFGYSPEEAALMDPQIRLFHEQCWKALEDAGYASCTEEVKVGLFAGASPNDNWKLYAYGKAAGSSVEPFYLDIIKSHNFISTLVSYKLNLRGPSLYIDTACSTSLVAIHLASRSLLMRECKLALAGGTSLRSTKSKGYFYREGMINSKDGKIRAFDKDATGALIGEGTGVVVLKRLSEAEEDGDHVYAIIRSTFVNNDGNHKVGYAAPSVNAQGDCITGAHRLAGVEPRSIGYVETHGTATQLGDSVEVSALHKSFGLKGGPKSCAIGSVKTNIGHLGEAAGIAGFIKTLLAIKYKLIPPSLHFKEPNPQLDLESGPFFVNTELRQWKNQEYPLRAGVSAFGIGGTNAHIVLEEAPERAPSSSGRPFRLLILSAKTVAALERMSRNLAGYLKDNPDQDFADVCYSLQVGRKEFSFRRKIVCEHAEEAIRVLSDPGSAHAPAHKVRGEQHPIVFVFSGLGSQYPGMCRDLYEKEPFFRLQMEECFELVKKMTGRDIRPVLYPPDPLEAGAVAACRAFDTAQLIVLITGYCLARLLMEWGIRPQAMIGYSFGEYVAACMAGVMSLEEAVLIINKRGQLIGELPRGAMLSVPLERGEVEPLIAGRLSLAIDNGPSCVVSGPEEAINGLEEELKRERLICVRLDTDRAVHSQLMEPVLPALESYLKGFSFQAPSIPYVSNVTGEWISAEEVRDGSYWCRHLHGTVAFSRGAGLLLEDSRRLYVEIGPGSDVGALLNRELEIRGSDERTFNLVPAAGGKAPGDRYLLHRLGQLWTHGVKINWNNFYKGEKRYRVSLPTYSFEPDRYPAEVDPFANIPMFLTKPVKNTDLRDWIYFPVWKQSLPHPAKGAETKRGYLFFAPDQAFSRAIVHELKKSNNRVIEVYPGDRYEKISSTEYLICPTDIGQYRQLMQELQMDRFEMTDILYAWGMNADASKMALEENNRELNLVYFSLVKIIQCLLQINGLGRARISVITNGLYRIHNKERGSYAQSLLLGLVNVLPQEYSVACCNIDLDPDEKVDGIAQLLTREIGHNAGKQDRIVALRNGSRWIKDYQRHAACLANEPDMLKEEGVYLITGGLGNAGFVLAKHLLQDHKAKLILIGRKKVGGKGPTGGTGGAEWEKRLSCLKDISKNVHYFSGDISDIGSFKQIVEEAEYSVGRIDGVIHTAGVINESYLELVQDSTPAKTLDVFSPKLMGVLNIFEIFKKRNPDFVWITSSIAAILGGLGFAAYSSSNLFMDHFVSHISEGLPNWKCVDLSGMALNEEEAGTPADVMSSKEVVALFDRSLSWEGCPVVLQSKEMLTDRISRIYDEKKDIYFNDNYDGYTTKRDRPDLSTPYVDPGTETENKLKDIFERLFAIRSVGIDDNFLELGGDSLKGMILLKRINEAFDVNLPLKDILVSGNIRMISARVDEVTWIGVSGEKRYHSII